MDKWRGKAFRLRLSFLIICSYLILGSVRGVAQEAGSMGVLGDSLSDLYTVAGVGLAGSVLGLSTLSFVDEPGENLKNIVTGGSIGIILGVGIVAWKHASRSKDFYDAASLDEPLPFKKKDFFEGAELFAKSNLKNSKVRYPPSVRYSFYF